MRTNVRLGAVSRGSLGAFFSLALWLASGCNFTAEDCGNGIDDDCDGDIDCADDECLKDYDPPSCTRASDCCRVCESGKPCGDSCIEPSSECSAPTGCACAQSDVCTGNELTVRQQCEADNPVDADSGLDPFAECEG